MHPNLNHLCQNKNHKSTKFYQLVPWNTPSSSYIDPWEFQQQEQFWSPSGTIIYPHGRSWLRVTSANSCSIQYPHHWVINIKPRKTLNLLLCIQQPTTENKNWKQSTYTQQSNSQKYHQEKFTLIKLGYFPFSQSVGKNTWWLSMHMTPTPFL